MAGKLKELLEPVTDFLDVAKDAIRDGESPSSLLHRYVSVRGKKDLDELYAEFLGVFGSEADAIVAEPIKDNRLNGDVDIKNGADESDYFIGRQYSLPLMAYIMRRALDKADSDEAYLKYVKNIDVLFKEENVKIEKDNEKVVENYHDDPDNAIYDYQPLLELHAYPSKWLIEEICADALHALAELKNARELKSDGYIDDNPSDVSEPDV